MACRLRGAPSAAAAPPQRLARRLGPRAAVPRVLRAGPGGARGEAPFPPHSRSALRPGDRGRRLTRVGEPKTCVSRMHQSTLDCAWPLERSKAPSFEVIILQGARCHIRSASLARAALEVRILDISKSQFGR